jgi:hypothetical protein
VLLKSPFLKAQGRSWFSGSRKCARTDQNSRPQAGFAVTGLGIAARRDSGPPVKLVDSNQQPGRHRPPAKGGNDEQA